jgi:hypothetical protein
MNKFLSQTLIFFILLQLFSTAQAYSLKKAFDYRKSDVQVKGKGIVIILLNDDNKGSRHQKFILKLSTGQTILISHNIDISQRINSLSKGDVIRFYGEYEWNKKGGVVHWTHKDPNNRHINGWLKHKGILYQ